MTGQTLLTAEMRLAATILEKVAEVYKLSPQPAQVEISAAWLRHEADYLDTPIHGFSEADA